MQQGIFEIRSNERLTGDICRMVLCGDTGAIVAPGQFVNIRIDGLFLRRPISVCDKNGAEITLVYKVQGKGTAAMADYTEGKKLDLLTGLGNGYDTEKSGGRPLLAGGGVGVPPLVWLAKTLISQGKKPTAVLGFNGAGDIILKDAFENAGIPTIITTVDGSVGIKGFVTDGMKLVDNYTHVYTCGPEPMLKAVYHESKTSGQFSFEERMGCGFGACMGCTCKTKYGSKRICKDGPVLAKEEIIW